jgi:hypothetical protein
MTVGELMKKLAEAPEDAEVSLITSRDSKWDGIYEVEVFKYKDGDVSIHLLGSSSWKAREAKEENENE